MSKRVVSKSADVIVVGAGPSGSVISAYLAKQGGKKVIAFEKTDLIGGPKFGGYFIEGGWHADLTHIPCYTVRDNGGDGKGGWIIPVAEELGAPFLWQYLPNYAIHMNGKLVHQPCVTEGRLWVEYIKGMMPFPMEEETERDLAYSYDSMARYPESKLWSEESMLTPVGVFLRDVCKDDLALTIWELLIAQTMTMNPEGILDEASIAMVIGSTMALWRGDMNMLGIFGGVDQIPRGFFKVAMEHGTELHLSTPVKRVIVKDGKATGVVVDNNGVEGTYTAKEVVIATEYSAIPGLLGDNLPSSIRASIDKWDANPMIDLDIHFGLSEPAIATPYSFCSLVDDAGEFECLVAALPDFGCGTVPEGKQIVQLQTFMRKTKYDLKTEAEHEQDMITAVEKLFPNIRKALANAEWRHATYSYNPFQHEGDLVEKVPFRCPGIAGLYFCGCTTAGWGNVTDKAISSAERLYKEFMKA